jgi:hypothetical protein
VPSPHEYLLGLLSRESITSSEIGTLQRLRDKIEFDLRGQFGYAPRFYYGGSYAKGTMLKSAYDLDIVMYFPSSETATLSNLFWSVSGRLRALGYVVHPRTVALRLPYEGGFHIDVVPGRAQDASFRYATLYENEAPPSTLQTSLKVHIDAITKTNIGEVVRVAKLWRLRQGLDFPTFPLEIAVGRALAGLRKDDLARATANVFAFLSGNVMTMRFEDPANSNNDVLVTPGQRIAIASAANRAIGATNWNQIVW